MPEPGPTLTNAEPATGPWSPLRVRLFRSLCIAGLVSNIGTFMHTVAAGWTVTDLTRSPTLVSLVQTAWTVPGFLLALLAGALADVLDRRRLIIATQFASMLVAAALGVFELGRVTPRVPLTCGQKRHHPVRPDGSSSRYPDFSPHEPRS